jgi:hypothetical protein
MKLFIYTIVLVSLVVCGDLYMTEMFEDFFLTGG